MITHIKATMAGVVGNVTTGGAFSIAWLTNDVMPVLHAISLCVGILAGLATAGYYAAAWYNERKKGRRK